MDREPIKAENMTKKTIYAKELMERWKINDLDLINLILEGLPAYDSQNTVRIEIQPNSAGRYPCYFDYRYVESIPYVSSLNLRRELTHYDGQYSSFINHLKSNINKIVFLPSDVEIFEKEHPASSIKTKYVRKSQQDKEKCRIEAKILWDKDPSKTIADVIMQCESGMNYTEKTVRGWIKDECPNPKAGRRKKC